MRVYGSEKLLSRSRKAGELGSAMGDGWGMQLCGAGSTITAGLVCILLFTSTLINSMSFSSFCLPLFQPGEIVGAFAAAAENAVLHVYWVFSCFKQECDRLAARLGVATPDLVIFSDTCFGSICFINHLQSLDQTVFSRNDAMINWTNAFLED